jgi:hypothetical protein
MKISNNTIVKKKNVIEKKFLDKKRFKREIYFYKKFKDKHLNIPRIIDIKDNKIYFKEYKFRKINSQRKFFTELLKFLILTNKNLDYKIHAKERLKSYKDLYDQVQLRFNNLNKINVSRIHLKKFNKIKLFLKDIIDECPKNEKLKLSKKIVSQSDIGFHNCALYEKKVIFFDFEYAGLDNPIKLICDVYYQPEKRIEKKIMINFLKNFQKEFKFQLPNNFNIFEKLYKAKMMLIILNIFLKSAKRFRVKSSSRTNFKKLQLERLNKAYRYIKIPYLYE